MLPGRLAMASAVVRPASLCTRLMARSSASARPVAFSKGTAEHGPAGAFMGCSSDCGKARPLSRTQTRASSSSVSWWKYSERMRVFSSLPVDWRIDSLTVQKTLKPGSLDDFSGGGGVGRGRLRGGWDEFELIARRERPGLDVSRAEVAGELGGEAVQRQHTFGRDISLHVFEQILVVRMIG